MLVKNWMSRNVITIDAEQSMQQAIYLLKDNHINLLPVMESGQLAGIISDRDLKKASPSDASTLDVHEMLYLIARIKIKDIMTRNPHTVTQDFTVEEAASILLENRISGLPVLDEKRRLIGIITRSDIFRLLISMTGLGKIGLQIAIRLKDRIGIIKEVKEIIEQFQGRTANILTSDTNAPEGFMNAYFRVYQIDRERLEELLALIREQGDLLYVVDYRRNRRDIYHG